MKTGRRKSKSRPCWDNALTLLVMGSCWERGGTESLVVVDGNEHYKAKERNPSVTGQTLDWGETLLFTRACSRTGQTNSSALKWEIGRSSHIL